MKFEFYFGEYGCTGNLDWVGMPDSESKALLLAVAPVGGVVYDIGAHEGAWTIHTLHCRPDLTVYSFEPLAERLGRNLALNRLPDSNVHAVALGGRDGTTFMTTNRRSQNHVIVHGQGGLEVPIVRLDSFIQRQGLRPPDFMKIDVEGMEYAVLRGAERILREQSPVVMCEINSLHKRYSVDLGSFLAYMRGFGYLLHRVWSGRVEPVKLIDITRARLEELGRSCGGNYLFVRHSRPVPESLMGSGLSVSGTARAGA